MVNRIRVTHGYIQVHTSNIRDFDFDLACSVIYTWGNDKSKAVIGAVTVPANVARTPFKKWELNFNRLTAGKECGSIMERIVGNYE